MIRRITALAVVVVLVVSVTTALATEMTVARAIVSQDRIFVSSSGYQLLGHFELKSAAQASSAIPKLQHTRKLLERAASVVSKASATTTAEKTGRKDWVTGAHLVATGVADLATGLQYLLKGDTTKANQVLKRSAAVDRQGGALAVKGDKLLGLPTTD